MRKSPYLPIFLAIFAACFWGIWWIPVRLLENAGMSGLWPGTAVNLFAVLFFGVGLILRQKRRLNLSPRGATGASVSGFSLALYAWSLAETDVAKSILLFYLAPVWSLILERVLLGKSFPLFTWALVGLAFVGIGFLFDWRFDFQIWNLGDTMALIAGFAWAACLIIIFSDPVQQPAPDLAGVSIFFAAASGLVLLLLPLGGPGSTFVFSTQTLLLALGFGILFSAPTMWITMWTASRLAPTTFCLLLTAEIATALITSAWLLNEPFGTNQILGSVLVVGTGTILGFATAKSA